MLSRTEGEFTKSIEFIRAWDKRPEYGVHGVDLRFVYRGPKGAAQFVLFTGWHVEKVRRENDIRGYHSRPMPADLGYHSYTPRYEDQVGQEHCEYLGGARCYYDGSGLNAELVFEVLINEGDEGVWRELERYYHQLFDEEEER